MADLLLAAAPPAPAAAAADLDALLDAVTAIKAQQKELDQQLEPLLEALNTAMATGQLDPSFSHNDWAFSHSPGRLTYDFPAAVQQIEQQLKAAKESAIQLGSAKEKRGNPFWTIRPPKTQPLPF
jgi:methyl-accepting chemotaxis protein